MDGILNEGIDSGELKRLYKTFYDVNPPEDIETQTRKILEKIIAYKAKSRYISGSCPDFFASQSARRGPATIPHAIISP